MTTPPEGIPAHAWHDAGAGTWYDDQAFMAYEIQGDGSYVGRPYTELETEQAIKRTNDALLRQRAAAAISANNADIVTADSIAGNTGLNAAIRALGAQSSRQAKQLNALIKLVLADVTDTSGT